MTDTTTAAPVIGANKNGKPVAPNEGARKNPVAPVAGTTNDGAMQNKQSGRYSGATGSC